MLFTWDWHNSCIVFKLWHVRSTIGFLFSLVGIVLLTIGYEALKYYAAIYKRRNRHQSILAESDTNRHSQVKFTVDWATSIIYGLQVSYSFLIMLIFMSFNGWYMFAVGVGATIGYKYFHLEDAPFNRSLSCH